MITSFAFSIGMVSNTLEPAVIGQRAIDLVPANARNTAIGITTFVGLILAVLVQPIIGALSDRMGGRWGRRRPFLILGTVLTAGSLFIIAFSSALPLIGLGVLILYLGTNLAQIPGQALVPDHVPEIQHGKAAGFKATFELLAFVIGRLVSGELVALGQTNLAVSIPAGLLVFTLLLVLFTVPDPPTKVRVSRSWPLLLRQSFTIDLRHHPIFGWWFANRILFWCGFIAMQTFMLFFIIGALC